MTVESQRGVGAKRCPTQHIFLYSCSSYTRSCQKNYSHRLLLSHLFLVKHSRNFLVITRGHISSLIFLAGADTKLLLTIMDSFLSLSLSLFFPLPTRPRPPPHCDRTLVSKRCCWNMNGNLIDPVPFPRDPDPVADTGHKGGDITRYWKVFFWGFHVPVDGASSLPPPRPPPVSFRRTL